MTDSPAHPASGVGGAIGARAVIVITIVALIVATAGVAALTLLRPAPATALTPDSNMDMLSIPAFTLTAQDGRTITRDDLLGGVTILDFFFSSCPFICPPMSRNMKHAQDKLADTGVRFLSVSVDPERDTPERLREYAREVGADTSVWTFATGPREVVTRILRDGLLLSEPVEDERSPINLKDGGTMANILHPSHFIMLGPNAEIVSLYNGLSRDAVDELIARARAAAKSLSH